jgi:hypothetical protein
LQNEGLRRALCLSRAALLPTPPTMRMRNVAAIKRQIMHLLWLYHLPHFTLDFYQINVLSLREYTHTVLDFETLLLGESC